MKPATGKILIGVVLLFAVSADAGAAPETVATVVYGKVGHGYQRVQGPDGSFQPEYYALSNGGLIAGTTSDNTIARVTYPVVAEITARLLQTQNYHYAQSKEQAKLLLVLNWGATLSHNTVNYGQAVNTLAKAVNLQAEEKMFAPTGSAVNGGVSMEALFQIQEENRARDAINLPNAKILGYLDAINDANGIQRWAGGGDRYTDLLTDIEEPRYYIVISAYDFPALEKKGERKMLWQTRVSVRSAGNSFDQSFGSMLKSASLYFGRDSGKLVRRDEALPRVELGDLKYLGEAKEPNQSPTKEKK
ncbi:hypothetical protein Verru16b_01946 [Lacunisphaera limnophila]|uniref:Uncharacterized protein n=1 Tax=Lacunisphaera limnophila TaxID=1838286 RepID=A0A1D8AVF3_9BACT|nr:hypothetical protein [Lacunisphaera limnophila]AOS44877.1 hypothetical protein Verru16b_01946 [Lacunisphaera limnophila]